MIVGTMSCTCRLPAAQTLKDKRRIVKSAIARIRARHNLSVAEVAYLDVAQMTTIAMAGVANSKRRVEQELNRALKVLDQVYELEVLAVDNWFG